MPGFNNSSSGKRSFGSNSRGSSSGGPRRSFGSNSRGGSSGGRSFGGGNRGGFNRGPRRDFGDRQMHKTTCSECKKECEVPFKPSEDRPVYCKECFFKKKDSQ